MAGLLTSVCINVHALSHYIKEEISQMMLQRRLLLLTLY